MLAMLQVLAGIGWEPEIRGALTVLVGSAVLMGSVWLILSTNLGSRLGTLNALAGFFAWMAIMGLVWWIYGGNVLRGDDPAWEPREIVFGDLSGSVVGDVDELAVATLPSAAGLVEEICPGLVDATVDLQRARVVEDNVDLVLDYDPPDGREFCDSEQIGELVAVDVETITALLTERNAQLETDDPRFLDEQDLEQKIEDTIADEFTKANQLTLSALAAVSPDLVATAADLGLIETQGWNILSSADAGEAQATASAFLTEAEASPYDDAGDFIVLDTFQKGGKPERASDGVWDRLANEIRNTVVFWHPTNTAVVRVVGTLDKELVPGEAPPFPEIDPDAQIVSVVMVRDLGSRRLPAALITIGSTVILLGLCWMMHTRDLALRRRMAEWDPAAAT